MNVALGTGILSPDTLLATFVLVWTLLVALSILPLLINNLTARRCRLGGAAIQRSFRHRLAPWVS